MNFEEINIKKIEQIIEYTFIEKQLLITAFTHSSYSNENNAESNEKLEFLGDSLLNFIVSEFLFGSVPNEGLLTRNRAKIVSALPLANAVKKLKLMKYVRFGVGVIAEKMSPKSYSNLFEAIIGAMYLDGGIFPPKKFISNNLIFDSYSKTNDYKTRLQEFVQKTHKDKQIIYEESFDEKSKTFVSEVYVFGKVCGLGKGVRKKEAQQNAARAALETLEK